MGSATAMLMGLVIYGCAALVATQAEHFITLLAARAVSAFGIAVGSVVTQTILRDVFSGNELGKVFSLMGMGIAISCARHASGWTTHVGWGLPLCVFRVVCFGASVIGL